MPRAAPRLSPAVVVLVSNCVQERVRAVAALGDIAPILLVDDARQARDILGMRSLTREGPAPVEPAIAARGETPVDRSASHGATVPPAHKVVLPGLVLDRREHTISTARGRVRLTALEFAFLCTLVSAPGQVRQFADLVTEVWGTSHLGHGGQVHSVVKRLRRKLTGIHAPVVIQAVRGVGFRIVHQRPGAAPDVSPAPRRGPRTTG